MNALRLTVVHMPWYPREHPAPELGLLTAVLRLRHRVTVLDLNNEMFHRHFRLRPYWKHIMGEMTREKNREFYEAAADLFDAYAERIAADKPDAVIFKITNNNYYNAEYLAGVLRRRSPALPVVISGMHVAPGEEQYYGHADFPWNWMTCGNDIDVLPRLVEAIGRREAVPPADLKREGRLIDCRGSGGIRDFNALPHLDFSDLDFTSYAAPDKCALFMSQGCPWRCAFCNAWCTDEQYRSMSGDRIFSEVACQLGRHPSVAFIRFTDKCINGSIPDLEQFCDRMIEGFRGGLRPVAWGGDAVIRPEMTPALLTKIRSSGCSGLGYGLESASPRVLRDMRKAFSPEIAASVIRDTADAGLRTSVNILVGFPTETRDDFKQTMDFIAANRGAISEIRLTFAGCQLHGSAEIRMHPERYGIAETDAQYWKTIDGSNTYEERARRSEEICELALSLGIELMAGGRPSRRADALSGDT